MTSAPEPVDLNHTLSVKHDDLEYFANTQLKNFLHELAADPGYTSVLAFAGEGAGDYTGLLTGHGTEFPLAENVKTNFKALATGLAGDLKTLGVQMTEAQLRIQLTLTIMDAAHEEAMTAAEMMQILNKVGSAAPPKTGSGTGTGSGT
ncbi:hypothetical protein [Kitasatospora sp. NPDC097643]|uniref:hypothetical protein n=1 Tax=Kitasatospora sp. NPDC097643 TaxID=3157230 RepID=UPI003322E980